jgi:hypothetical protein
MFINFEFLLYNSTIGNSEERDSFEQLFAGIIIFSLVIVERFSVRYFVAFCETVMRKLKNDSPPRVCLQCTGDSIYNRYNIHIHLYTWIKSHPKNLSHSLFTWKMIKKQKTIFLSSKHIPRFFTPPYQYKAV